MPRNNDQDSPSGRTPPSWVKPRLEGAAEAYVARLAEGGVDDALTLKVEHMPFAGNVERRVVDAAEGTVTRGWGGGNAERRRVGQSPTDHIVRWLAGETQHPDWSAYLLKHGRAFTPSKLPPGMRVQRSSPFGKQLLCFYNATVAMREHEGEGWEYVEGYATKRGDPEGLQGHAWNLGPDGELIDLTWGGTGVAYYGAVLPWRTVDALLHELGGPHPVGSLLVERGAL